VSLTPRERAPGNHWIGSWVDPTADLDDVVKKIKISLLQVVEAHRVARG
jgi:hypothetical protein